MDEGRHQGSEGSGASGIVPILVSLLLVLGGAGATWMLLKPDSSGGSSQESDGPANCPTGDRVALSVVPQMEKVAAAAVEAIRESDRCFALDLRVQTPRKVIDSFFTGGRPDLWIADSTARAERLKLNGTDSSIVAKSLASTPVVLVGRQGAQAPASWLEALSSPSLASADPEVDSYTSMALVAPLLEAKKTGASAEQAKGAVVNAAQAFGSRASDGKADPVALTEVTPTFTRLIPSSEQEMLTAGSANVKVVTPPTGSPVLDFPLVQVAGGAKGAAQAAQRISTWFASDAGREALATAGLRGPDRAPLPGRGLGKVTTMGQPPVAEYNGLLGQWQMLSVPSSILAVFDASGSMDFEVPGGKTRMDLAVDAALTALDIFPSHARIGVWAFSIDQGGPGKDWREMAPMKRLDATTKGVKHAQYMREQVPTLKSITQGGTGLYDTTEEAYEAAVKSYDKNYFNSVILLSDGANDDPGSISLKDLLSHLKRISDPERPVKIISIGITKDADMPALTKISEVTGGKAYLAEDPNDILSVFAQALLSRGN